MQLRGMLSSAELSGKRLCRETFYLGNPSAMDEDIQRGYTDYPVLTSEQLAEAKGKSSGGSQNGGQPRPAGLGNAY